MPRPAKGPRLYLRKGRIKHGQPVGDVWVIRDGQVEISTGCPPERRDGPDGAEAALGAYIAGKWAPPADRAGDPARVYVAEVLAFYLQKRAPKLADPQGTAVRVRTLDAWWCELGRETLADVKMSTCEAYVDHRTKQPLRQARRGAALEKRVSPAAARRELEDLSAAIAFWGKEHPLTARPVVTLPLKDDSPRDALTRSQAAALLKAALGWRWIEPQGRWVRLSRSARANRAHLRRFILIGLYTGTRPGVIPKLLWAESPHQAWADLDAGMIYRRGRSERDHRTKRRPVVRLPGRLLAHMRRWRKADLERGTVSVIHHGGDALAGRIRRAFESCVRDAGLPAEITPHWMRRTCATWLMQNGAPLWDAAAYTGMTTKTLESCYGHHRPDHQDRARRALGG